MAFFMVNGNHFIQDGTWRSLDQWESLCQGRQVGFYTPMENTLSRTSHDEWESLCQERRMLFYRPVEST